MDAVLAGLPTNPIFALGDSPLTFIALVGAALSVVLLLALVRNQEYAVGWFGAALCYMHAAFAIWNAGNASNPSQLGTWLDFNVIVMLVLAGVCIGCVAHRADLLHISEEGMHNRKKDDFDLIAAVYATNGALAIFIAWGLTTYARSDGKATHPENLMMYVIELLVLAAWGTYVVRRKTRHNAPGVDAKLD